MGRSGKNARATRLLILTTRVNCNITSRSESRKRGKSMVGDGTEKKMPPESVFNKKEFGAPGLNSESFKSFSTSHAGRAHGGAPQLGGAEGGVRGREAQGKEEGRKGKAFLKLLLVSTKQQQLRSKRKKKRNRRTRNIIPMRPYLG
eukprot:8601704-Pyramimonas_sp.AAC.1